KVSALKQTASPPERAVFAIRRTTDIHSYLGACQRRRQRVIAVRSRVQCAERAAITRMSASVHKKPVVRERRLGDSLPCTHGWHRGLVGLPPRGTDMPSPLSHKPFAKATVDGIRECP